MSEYKDREYYESLDKRTKEYKEWKERFEQENSTGLGDVVEKITKATGIKAAVKFVAGEDCGCEERKKKLNNLRWKGRRNVNCLTEDEYNDIKILSNKRRDLWTHSDQQRIVRIQERVFNLRYQGTITCADCIRSAWNDIKEVFDNYGGTTV